MSEEEKKAEEDSEYYGRKREHMVRDWEATQVKLQLLDKWVEALRGWSITVVLAYLGFMTASDRDWTGTSFWAVWGPLAGAILVFAALEVAMKSQSFYFRGYIEEIDNAFSRPTPKAFNEAVKKHKFLSQRRKKIPDQVFRGIRAIKESWTWLWCLLLWAIVWIVINR